MNSSFIAVYVAMFLCIYVPLIQARNRRQRNNIKKRRKKGVKKMPVEMLKELIGKQITIYMEGLAGGFVGTILSIEGNWIKFEEKKNIRLINGDMIYHIKVAK